MNALLKLDMVTSHHILTHISSANTIQPGDFFLKSRKTTCVNDVNVSIKLVSMAFCKGDQTQIDRNNF